MPKNDPHILRAMSLNIWNYNPPWPRRRELIVRTVRETDPDIIGFQEIRHDGARNDAGRNQAEQLAERLPDYRFVYRPAQRDPEDGRWEGLAIFSRLPFRSSSYIELSRDASDGRDNHQRIVLHAEIETPAGPLHFFNTHLSLSRKGRSRTVREITAFVRRYSDGLPGILVGDFNEIPDGDPIRHITREAGFIDAWAHLHPGEQGWTYAAENAYVREKGGGKEGTGRRIDYIFIRPSGEGRAGLLACRRIADRPAEDGRFPTDHFGLAADLRLDASA